MSGGHGGGDLLLVRDFIAGLCAVKPHPLRTIASCVRSFHILQPSVREKLVKTNSVVPITDGFDF